MTRDERYAPERVARGRKIEADFRRAIERGEVSGDVIRNGGPSPAPPDRRPLRRLKAPPTDADNR